MEYVCKSEEERMKKAVILGLIALNISVFAAIKQEVPEDIEKAIIRESQSFEGSDRMSFRRWQTESYLKMEKMETCLFKNHQQQQLEFLLTQ